MLPDGIYICARRTQRSRGGITAENFAGGIKNNGDDHDVCGKQARRRRIEERVAMDGGGGGGVLKFLENKGLARWWSWPRQKGKD